MSEAFVTLATNDAYSLGCLVLAKSLRKCGTCKQLVVMITKGVSRAMIDQLAQCFDLIREVDIVDSMDELHLQLLGRPELGITLTKINCWRLVQYTKCVFMDADTLVLRSIDELFLRQELSAAPDVGWPDCFNSGVFVFEPSLDTYRSLRQLANSCGSFDGGDQGLLNMYFRDWAFVDIGRHLPFTYNMVAHSFYSYLPAYLKFKDDVKVVHFIGPVKPWHQIYSLETAHLQLMGTGEQNRDFLNTWWHVMVTSILPSFSIQLRDFMFNLPFEDRASQMKDVYDREIWQQGKFDYAGDRFINIQQRLDTAMQYGTDGRIIDQSQAPFPAMRHGRPIDEYIQTEYVGDEWLLDAATQVSYDEIIQETRLLHYYQRQGLIPREPTRQPQVQIKSPEPVAQSPPPPDVASVKSPEPSIKSAKLDVESVKSRDPSGKSEEPSVKSPEPSIRSQEISIKSPEPSVKSPEASVKSPEPSVKSPEPSVKSQELSVKTPEPSLKSTRDPSMKSPEPSMKSPSAKSQEPDTLSVKSKEPPKSPSIASKKSKSSEPSRKSKEPSTKSAEPSIKSPSVKSVEPDVTSTKSEKAQSELATPSEKSRPTSATPSEKLPSRPVTPSEKSPSRPATPQSPLVDESSQYRYTPKTSTGTQSGRESPIYTYTKVPEHPSMHEFSTRVDVDNPNMIYTKVTADKDSAAKFKIKSINSPVARSEYMKQKGMCMGPVDDVKMLMEFNCVYKPRRPNSANIRT